MTNVIMLLLVCKWTVVSLRFIDNNSGFLDRIFLIGRSPNQSGRVKKSEGDIQANYVNSHLNV